MLDGNVVGNSAEVKLVVTQRHTAAEWGSGGLYVLSTPQMIGMMEEAAVRVIDHLLPEGYQSVGIKVDVRHLAATPTGKQVTARATLEAIEGQRFAFAVEAYDEGGFVGKGRHERYAIETSSFLANAQKRIQETDESRA